MSSIQEPNKRAPLSELHSGVFHLVWIARQEAEQLLAPFALNTFKASVLELLGDRSMHPRELAEALVITPPALSSVLSELEDRGLIERRVDQADRRRAVLILTPKGDLLRRQILAAWQEVDSPTFERLGLSELAALSQIQAGFLEKR